VGGRGVDGERERRRQAFEETRELHKEMREEDLKIRELKKSRTHVTTVPLPPSLYAPHTHADTTPRARARIHTHIRAHVNTAPSPRPCPLLIPAPALKPRPDTPA
jgi:hypothetical protein